MSVISGAKIKAPVSGARHPTSASGSRPPLPRSGSSSLLPVCDLLPTTSPVAVQPAAAPTLSLDPAMLQSLVEQVSIHVVNMFDERRKPPGRDIALGVLRPDVSRGVSTMTRAGPPLVSPTNEGDTPTLRGFGTGPCLCVSPGAVNSRQGLQSHAVSNHSSSRLATLIPSEDES